jgi:hypothetical protein
MTQPLNVLPGELSLESHLDAAIGERVLEPSDQGDKVSG